MRNKLLRLLICLLPAALMPISVSADELDYRATIESAVEAYSQQRYDEALGLFLKAHALAPSARTLRGIGLASFDTRRYADAVRYLTEALQDIRVPLTPAMRSEAQRVIGAAAPFIVHLQLDLQPADAEVTIDGQALARVKERAVLLDPGPHQIVAKAPGYQLGVRSVQWPPGTHATLELHLAREIGAGAANEEKSSARAADLRTPPLQEGKKGGRSGRFRALKWVALAMTTATLAATGVAIGLRERRARAIVRTCTGELSLEDRETCEQWRHDGRAWKRTSIATGALAGALAATTVVLFATDRPRESKAARALGVCALGLGTLQLSCHVQF